MKRACGEASDPALCLSRQRFARGANSVRFQAILSEASGGRNWPASGFAECLFFATATAGCGSEAAGQGLNPVPRFIPPGAPASTRSFERIGTPFFLGTNSTGQPKAEETHRDWH